MAGTWSGKGIVDSGAMPHCINLRAREVNESCGGWFRTCKEAFFRDDDDDDDDDDDGISTDISMVGRRPPGSETVLDSFCD